MCVCAKLPAAIYVEDEPPGFLASLVEVATGNWVKLCQCPRCQQLWRVDEWDKYQTQFAVKVPSRDDWQSFNAKPLQLERLVESRGGLSNEKCIWASCKNRAIRGVVYCPEHLYETGARR
jgi:hypothetical protein